MTVPMSELEFRDGQIIASGPARRLTGADRSTRSRHPAPGRAKAGTSPHSRLVYAF
jgi:hypothetical protein